MSEKGQNVTLSIGAVVVVALLSVAGLAYYTITAVQEFRAADTSWQTYNKNTRETTNSLSIVQRSMGYGGFIHHFKITFYAKM